jgi:demethylmenaquinone methyltransferase/2-methoxy-6-polyprenyl-1,4-benzoquinol methylase
VSATTTGNRDAGQERQGRSGNQPEVTTGKGASVRELFAEIAPRYDAANRAISAGMDEGWRRRAVRELGAGEGARILDLCTGTGDLAFHLAATDPSFRITGIDFCEPMLDGARRRRAAEGPGVEFVTGDILALPFEDAAFDGATMGFSMRNIVDIPAALREIRRVLRPGARFVNLDMSHPPNKWQRKAFELYFQNAVPLIGGLVSKSPQAYRYLPNSLVNYPAAERLAAMFGEAGFSEARFERLLFGAVAVHVGTK